MICIHLTCTELYVSFNDLSDLSPLSLHETLETLDLEGNQVADYNMISQLGKTYADLIVFLWESYRSPLFSVSLSLSDIIVISIL
jgi:Leucine-rich repeat (LRR) protein